MRTVVIAVLSFIPLISFGKGNDFSVFIQNGLLLNKKDVTRQSTSGYLQVKNTLLQSIGCRYTFRLKNGIIFPVSVSFGYEKYDAAIKYPFEDFGFVRPKDESGYYIKSTIPYAELAIGVGYQLDLKKFKLEAFVSQMMQTPFRSVYYGGDYEELSRFGYMQVSHYKFVTLGKPTSRFSGQLINSIYAGITVPAKLKFLESYKIGIQLQQLLFKRQYTGDRIAINYEDVLGFARGTEEFSGTHTSISLVLGMTF